MKELARLNSTSVSSCCNSVYVVFNALTLNPVPLNYVIPTYGIIITIFIGLFRPLDDPRATESEPCRHSSKEIIGQRDFLHAP